MPYFVNKTPIIAYFKNNGGQSHIFAGKSHPVRSEQAPFAKITPNREDLTMPRLVLLAWFQKQVPRGVTYSGSLFRDQGSPGRSHQM